MVDVVAAASALAPAAVRADISLGPGPGPVARPSLGVATPRLGTPHRVSCQMLPDLPDEVIRLRLDNRGDPWWRPERPLLRNLLALPRRFYMQLFHYSRPDTHHKVMRAAEWQHIHSEWRYLHSLFVYVGRPTQILWKVKVPLALNMVVAALIIVNEEAVADKLFAQVPTFAHEAVIQMIGLTTFILALLLTLRLNRTYERWWDGWRAFRRVGDCATALTQQATVYCSDDAALQADIARWSVLWCYSLTQFCSGAACLDPLARRLLTVPEAAIYDAAPNKFNLVELKLRRLIARMKLPTDQAISVDGYFREGFQNVRVCSTIKQTALPYALTLMCTGFIEIALMILPIGFIGRHYHRLSPNLTLHQRISGVVLLLGLYVVTNLLLLGADQVACQLEDPFRVLPLDDRTECVVDLIRRTFDEAQDLAELEAVAEDVSAGNQQWGELSRAQTLKTLDNICLSVQPMHKSESWAHISDEIVMRRSSEVGGRLSTVTSAGGGAAGGGRSLPLTPKLSPKDFDLPV
ncbi:hypothetical protein Rsub_03862 [Raphidocelis subcapitata]|uniref:Uncharacterized protein n=1 Tax=Raphidocelis subcapitata TaxID=307507 RepID=A0A2V0P1D5_9CHLO|nr:hypothetical protein Rsub_03862 [Raphidocelis subcapitata]|eukprot:GBF91007.1 hypothetical protein Rsub_03862 [Raphidocelis subcapitata]